MGAALLKRHIAELLLATAVGASLAIPAWAQDDLDELPAVSRAVVQQLPNQGGAQLNAALTRLAANPRDVGALLDAGNAAMNLGDTGAALGFYGRADEISPGNPRVKAALASAMVRSEDPFAAIPMFDAAERAGARDPLLEGDRGLAYDLVGDNGTAQGHYRRALASVQSDEIARRLALSLAIAGDRKGSEAALLPQIRRNDRAGWRTRAFALAILGDTEEAVRIASGTMPPDLAAAMIPYLRYMGRLTPSQQAAAANFGHFPRAAQIGRDDPRVARYAVLNPRKSPVPGPGMVQAATSNKKGKDRKRDRDAARTPTVLAQARTVAAPTPAPAPSPAPLPRYTPPPVRVAAATPNPGTALARVTQMATSASPPAVAVTPAPAPVVVATTPAPTPAPTPPPTQLAVTVPQTPAGSAPAPAAPAQVVLSLPAATSTPATAAPSSNLDLARRAQQGPSESGAPQAAAVPNVGLAAPVVAPPVATPAPRRDLASVFGDFRPPADEQAVALAAVDLSKLPPRLKKTAPADERGPLPDAPSGTKRTTASDPPASTAKKGTDIRKAGEKAKAEKVKPAAPSHPSRIWVQVGVGRDKAALGFDWRKYQRTLAELFKAKKPWTTPWGQTNRLLVGPFETQAAAQAFLKDLKKKDVDAFVWTSPAGQAVDALAAK